MISLSEIIENSTRLNSLWKSILPPSAAKENFLDCHFDQFCEAKLVEMAI